MEVYIAELREQILILSDRAAQHVQRIAALTKENAALKEQVIFSGEIKIPKVEDTNV